MIGMSAVSRIGAQRTEQTQPVDVWHHDVGEDQVGPTLADRGQGLRAVRDRLHRTLVSQQTREVLTHVGVVVGQQDVRGGLSRLPDG